MKIGIPKEIHAGEKRVATTPDVTKQLIKLGFEVAIESSAGAGSSFSDSAYTEAGATVVRSAKSIWQDSDIILKVRAPEFNPELNSGALTFKIISLSCQINFALLTTVAPASV